MPIDQPTTARERVSTKLADAVKEDIKESKIRISIGEIEMTDGKFTANFNIRGLPQKKGDYDSSYRNIPKIFDTFDDLHVYAKAFFEKTDEELKKIAEENKSK